MAAGLKLTTYNVGLAKGFVEYSQLRLPLLKKAIAESDSDILCLQELWSKSDRKKMTRALKKSFPYSYQVESKMVKTTSAPACKTGDLFGEVSGEKRLLTCMQDLCSDKKDSSKNDCILQKCDPAFKYLAASRPECLKSVYAQVSLPLIQQLYNLLGPFQRPSIFSYRGGNGLAIYSKHPITKTASVDLKDISSTVRRVGLYAQVKVDGVDRHIVCAHLQANLASTMTYAGDLAGFKQESLAQAKEILKFMDQSVGKKSGQRYLLGDFNCSFENKTAKVKDDFVEICNLIKADGYDDFVSSYNPETIKSGCSFCSRNTLTSRTHKNILIDHIFTKGVATKTPPLVTIDFDNEVTVKVKGKNIKTNLSDHFGVSLKTN